MEKADIDKNRFFLSGLEMPTTEEGINRFFEETEAEFDKGIFIPLEKHLDELRSRKEATTTKSTVTEEAVIV